MNPPYRLGLDIVPSSSSAVTCALRKCFREESINMYAVSFQSKQRKTSNAVKTSSLIYFDYKQGSFGSR